MKNPGRKTGKGEKRLRMSEQLLWGIHPVYEALQNEGQKIAEIFLQKDRKGGKVEEITRLAREIGVKLNFVSVLKLTGEGAGQVRHQGIVARVSQIALVPFSVVLDNFRKCVELGEKPGLLICDSLQDPHNLGAVIRSGYASGMQGVVLTRERSAPLSGVAVKSSAGAVSHVDICQVTNLVNALKELKDAGAWVFGTVKDERATSLYETDLNVPACIVVGNEGKGIRPLVKRECDISITIPMEGKLDSLNISAAAAVIMFERLRQRKQPVGS